MDSFIHKLRVESFDHPPETVVYFYINPRSLCELVADDPRWIKWVWINTEYFGCGSDLIIRNACGMCIVKDLN